MANLVGGVKGNNHEQVAMSLQVGAAESHAAQEGELRAVKRVVKRNEILRRQLSEAASNKLKDALELAHLEYELDFGDDNEGFKPEEKEEVHMVDEPPSNEVST
ncbi:hypothetical protein D8674_037113 [Pyrus ussuriensis x Pyrus communis]|uniref:Uncharacterized protein n=1 Tax=Pyrus ussuriensis x Pyrus communis TaxID=2448454 RepID=A0A5N5FNX4_9ROSA|nr:hypothetical protein D8674_037113 [Pyrus ussuriensis x Pyrus communis]